jgi:hypothetical protein
MTDFSAATWRKATRSNGSGGECVEIAFADEKVGVRDSKKSRKTTPRVHPRRLERFS